MGKLPEHCCLQPPPTDFSTRPSASLEMTTFRQDLTLSRPLIDVAAAAPLQAER